MRNKIVSIWIHIDSKYDGALNINYIVLLDGLHCFDVEIKYNIACRCLRAHPYCTQNKNPQNLPLSEELQGSGVESLLVYVFVHASLHPHICDWHLVTRKSPRLVRADVVRSAHSLTRRQIPHQVVFILHFTYALGQGDCDSQGQTLWHCDDDDRHADDKEVHNAPKYGKADKGLTVHDLLDQEMHGHGAKGQRRHSHTQPADIVSQILEFDLQGSSVFLLVHALLLPVVVGVGPHCAHNRFTCALDDFRAGDQEGVCLVVWGVLGRRKLLAEVTFARYAGLISLEVARFDYDGIDGHYIADFDRQDVADHQSVDGDGLDAATTDDVHISGIGLLV